MEDLFKIAGVTPEPEETEAEKEAMLDEIARQRGLKQIRERITKEGFEIGAWDADGETCRFRVWRKTRNRWGHEYCGKAAVVSLGFAGPSNPHGVREPFCKSCIAAMAKDLIGYLYE